MGELLAKGADVESKQNNGCTSLMSGKIRFIEKSFNRSFNYSLVASKTNKISVVIKLLESGANEDVKDNNGKTAVDFSGFTVIL